MSDTEVEKFKMSGFFAEKTNREQKLEISDEIAICNRILNLVGNISIGSGEGCLSGVKIGESSSGIQVFPDISDRMHHGLRKVITEYKEDMEKAKKQVEDEELR